MQASIITIGDEILIGQIVDTNSAWLAQELNEIGVRVRSIVTVGDNWEQIIDSINSEMKSSDFVFITGGLGPTNDDITKDVLCEIFDCKMKLSDAALANVNEMLGKRGIAVNENNYNQAMVPEKAQVFVNKLGTAPGMMFKNGDKLMFSMPGVPFEMKFLCENYFLPYISENYEKNRVFHKTLLVVGLPEAILAEKLTNWENSLPEEIGLAYLPSPGFIRLRLSIYKANDELIKLAEHKALELNDILPDNLKANEDLKPEALLKKIFVESNKTLSTAESCTGGKIASLITSVPGSSEYFKGSVVAYENDIKSDVLNVNVGDILRYGAVSKQVVEQMATGVRELMKTDYAVSTSGVAGPGGGTTEKPVGTVWIAVASEDKLISKKFRFLNDREINIQRSVNAAIMILIDTINS